MLFLIQTLHISCSVTLPFSYKHNLFGHGIVPLGVPYDLHFVKLKSVY